MRYVSAANQHALEQRMLVARDFLWLVARDRKTGAPVTEGLWSDVGNITAAIVNPDNGLAETRIWYGAGSLIAIDDIPLVANLSVQNVTIRMSQVHEEVERIVRDYDCRQARVEVYRGLFNPETRLMVAPAECRFVGFVDKIELKTPSENEDGAVTMTCASHTQEFTRSNTETRSHASQILRDPNDTFYKDAATVEDWEVWWGSEKGKVPTQKKRKKFLGIF
ncbi:hypothetical protein [Pseudochrobactrum saccharolyticum]|uniref:hypothetical protein n=1 Tax=Pseudochrobactrum saccharolyticum TaxID=354352 RepID=UPI002767B6C0|nr:hypothetical protein [Pseudochrobactrum saccharolyticum]MDP8249627.1 hypothetical protein [Pseudochrobactrum saccharolyticum]